MAIKPSTSFAVFLLFMHTAVATVVCLTAMPISARLVLLLLITLSLLYHLARDALLMLPNSWCEISPDPGGLFVVARDGSGFLGQVANNTIISPYFIILRVNMEGHHLPVSRVVFPDALAAGVFRELCVLLKFS
ncbi:MAG: protein YgfX [Gallionella sp.]